MADRLVAFNFQEWIDENRHLLKPPVGAKQVWDESDDYVIIVVGGPNDRPDFHINETEEFFYQLEGDMVLKVKDEDGIRDINIRQGDVFLLPPNTTHSPRRPANTVGMVVERKRDAHHVDKVLWFCNNCESELHREEMHVTDLAGQLKPLIENFYASVEQRTCGECGEVMAVPD